LGDGIASRCKNTHHSSGSSCRNNSLVRTPEVKGEKQVKSERWRVKCCLIIVSG
jgi:hypothetical protein